MDITGKYRRMDSIMIEANIKKLSRLELIYKCISNHAQYIHKADSTVLHSDLLHYTEPDDINKIFYHKRSSNADECAAQLLFDADKLLELSKKSNTISKDYAMLTRCLSEQTIYENGKRRLRTKDDGSVPSDSLQSPSDPDATFRTKMGKAHRGYVANLEESVVENGSIITDYQYEQNNKSDSTLFKEYLNDKERTQDHSIIIADGAYGGKENTELAADKNIELITTSLTGSNLPQDIYAEFEFS